MKQLRTSRAMMLSGLSVFGAATIAFLILLALDARVAMIVACAILATLLPVYKYFRERQIGQLLLGGDTTVSGGVSSFSLKWYLILLYGSLFLFAAIQGAAMLLGLSAGLAIAMTKIDPQILSVQLSSHDYRVFFDLFQGTIVLLIVALIRPTVTYLVGKWVGKKGSEHGIALMIAIPILVSIMDFLLVAILPGLIASQSNQTEATIIEGTIRMEIISLIISVPLGLLGYWRGRKKILNGYLQDLFKHVPREKRATVVESLYQEIVAINTPKAAWVETPAAAHTNGG